MKTKETQKLVRKYSLGYALRLLGRVLLILGGLTGSLSIILVVFRRWEAMNGIYFSILAVSVAALGGYVYSIGKKMTVRSPKDPRSPVLYLRSFTDDKVAAKIVKPSPFDAWRSFRYLSPPHTEEETIADELKRIGPCIAVGLPGERLPELGMARIYFPADEWREGVQELMQDAELVVMRAGTTPGFLWELEMAVKLVDPKKLLILLPFTGEDNRDLSESSDFVNFRDAANRILPQGLPVFSVTNLSWISFSAVISFKSDWSPKILRIFDVGSTVQESFEAISKRYVSAGSI